jgi:hypothetical protein
MLTVSTWYLTEEPSFFEQIAYLQTKHLPEQILAMYHVRQIGSMQNKPISTDFDFDNYLIGVWR